jgi:hypothetical protein
MGRRSHGPRELLGARVAADNAQRYRKLAGQYGLTQNDLLVALLEIGVRHIDELESSQGELPLNRAS